MRIRARHLAVLLLLVSLSVRLPAQLISRQARLSAAPPAPPSATVPSAAEQLKVQPSVRLKPPPSDAKELDYFAGVWNEQGGWKACVISQEGWFSTQYRNQWTKGHLSSSWTGSGRSGQEILSYDSKQGVYKWHDDGTPGKDDWKGKLKGKTWTWTGEVGRLSNGRMVKGRYTEKEGTPSSYSFWFEISVKGGPWKKVMEGNANRLFR